MSATLSSGTYIGDCTKALDCDGLKFLEHRCLAHSVIEEHSHAEAYFCLILQGTGVEHTEGITRRERPGCLSFQPAGCSHAGTWGAVDGKTFTVEMADNRREGFEEAGMRSRIPARAEGRAVELCYKMHLEFRRRDRWSALVLDGLMNELVAEFARQKALPLPPKWLRKLPSILRDDVHGELTLAQLASMVATHPTHLARAFRGHFGCTVGEYRRNLRIRHARQLLEAGLPLGEVAQEIGYSDQSHFTAAFKRATGLTPGAYRRERS